MYSLINQHSKEVVESVPVDFVVVYEWLLQNTNSQQIESPAYQQKYRNFWAMNGALLSSTFYSAYFRTLGEAMHQMPTLRSVVQTLYFEPTHRDGRKSIQFSFATKLLHMADRRSPIYDARVADFYFFQPRAKTFESRVSELLEFHEFLTEEYARVLRDGLLANSIQEFRSLHSATCWTDEKIIDSLVWAFVKRLHQRHIPYR